MKESPSAIEIKGLTRRYGKLEAVHGLDLTVRAGCCYGFFGRNGAGKTTTIKCLLNLLRPQAGSVRVFGLDPQREEVAVKSRLAYVPDAVAFYPWMTVRDTLDYFASFRTHWNRDIENDLLKRFGLDLNQKASTMSKGQKTQLALITAICPEPELLVLDEPTSGLDPIVRREFIETVIGAYQSSDPDNRTVFVSTHLISEFEGLIDEFTVIEQGRNLLTMNADEARDRFKKIVVRFAAPAPKLAFSGALQIKQNGREAEILANGNSEHLMMKLRAQNPEDLRCESLSLEEIFVASKTLTQNMSALVRKEIRLILPFWAIAMSLAVLPSVVVSRDTWTGGVGDGVLWIFGFGGVLLGLAPFGQEFGLGTFPSLLAQPSERRRIWNTKVGLTCVAGSFVLLAFALVVYLRLEESLRAYLSALSHHQWMGDASRIHDLEKAPREYFQSKLWSGVGEGIVVITVAIIGGFWTTLLFRQIGAALWFSILLPGVIIVASEIVGHIFMIDPNAFLVPALLVYAVAAFIWARRMFFTAQDAQWLGGTITLLSLTSAASKTETAGERGKKPVLAMLRKELQSHQVSLLIGFGLLVLHLATLVVRRFVSMPRNSEMRFAVEAVPLLWLLIPWVIGSVAVAEERKLGTMESQLCLPVSRRLQFTVKLSVVLLLGLVLGGLIPCLVESLGVLVGVPSEIVQPPGANNPATYFATVAETVLVAGIIAFIAFFASTLTRNTLHALGAAIAIGGAFIALFEWVVSESFNYQYSLWRGPLVLYMGVAVWFITLLSLSFWNYKRLHAGRNVWLRNFLVLGVALCCTGLAAAVIYQRPWELAISLEPKHDPARLSGSVRPEIVMPDNRIFALLPDGRLWAATDFESKVVARYEIDENVTSRNGRKEEVERLPVPRSGMFVGGSNWTALAASDLDSGVVALQSDGSLWDLISFNAAPKNFWQRWLTAIPEPRRIGSDSDWKSIACSGGGHFVAVKQDGTLWSWDYYHSTNYVATPVRVGTNSDWAAVFSGENSALFLKLDGDVWEWVEEPGKQKLEMVRMNLNGTDWNEVDSGVRNLLVIRQDGSLWSRNRWSERLFGVRMSGIGPARSGLVRVGQANDWVQVSAQGPAIGIKKNGRLVKNGTELFGSTLGRPSAYCGWIAVDSQWQSFVALNADGTVSLWCDTRGWNPAELLASTHRPLWSLNIFSDSKN